MANQLSRHPSQIPTRQLAEANGAVSATESLAVTLDRQLNVTLRHQAAHRSTLSRMSLTSHLRARDSPIRVWFERNLGQTRPVVAGWNDELCGTPRARCVIEPVEGSDSGLVGTATDYLVRAVLCASALNDTVATHGAHRPTVPQTAIRLEREAVHAIADLRPWESPPTGDALTELCRLCLVLARFDLLVRPGPSVVGGYVIQPLMDDPTLATYSSRVVPPLYIEDLSRLAPAAIEDHLDFRAQRFVLNPTFRLSGLLGGADADLIASGVLWDFKSTAQSAVADRATVWQLVGYALADTHDEYSIERVGISALRRRRRVARQLDELLATLSHERPRGIAAWRADFADAVLSSLSPVLARPG
jgi:hypothetical protein